MDCIVEASSFLAVCFLVLLLFFTNEYGYPMKTRPDGQSIPAVPTPPTLPFRLGIDEAFFLTECPSSRAFVHPRAGWAQSNET